MQVEEIVHILNTLSDFFLKKTFAEKEFRSRFPSDVLIFGREGIKQ